LAPLEELVEKINTEYSRLFRSIGKSYEGMIQVSKPEDKVSVLCWTVWLVRSYTSVFQYKAGEYGIDIRVRFRESTCFNQLNTKKALQSGGERSVSTMLYMMALQNVCHVPFRCVDEINQGMVSDYWCW